MKNTHLREANRQIINNLDQEVVVYPSMVYNDKLKNGRRSVKSVFFGDKTAALAELTEQAIRDVLNVRGYDLDGFKVWTDNHWYAGPITNFRFYATPKGL